MAETAPITHRRVLDIALPIVLANATVPILGLVDTGVVGQMGAAAPIGAVGLGAVIITAIYGIFNFLRMGTSGLAAQAHGARDTPEAGAILMRALLIGAAGGVGLILLQLPLMAAAFTLAPASAEVEDLARGYLGIRIWGAPATIALFAVTGWLIAVERTRAVLGLQLWLNGLNIGLDLWFVLGLDWGVDGVAAATIISEWTALGLGLWLCRGAFAGNAWRDLERILDGVRLRLMLRVNGDIMVRTVALQVGFVSFMFLGSGLGDVTLAANQVLVQFLHVVAFALDGFAFAAEALVGQAVGARSVRALRRSSVMTSQWGLVAALVLAAGFALLGPLLIDVMARDPAVQAAARAFLPWVVAGTLISLACYMLDGIFIGATATREMRNAMLVSLAVYGAVLLPLLPLMGNHGLWAAFMIFNLARGVTMALYYPRVEARAVA